MFKRKVQLALTFVMLLFSCLLLVWTFWPFRDSAKTLSAKGLHLILNSPEFIRVGDSDNVLLLVELENPGQLMLTDDGIEPVSEGDTVLDHDIYSTYNVLAAARLDLAGLSVVPGDMILQPVHENESISFFWRVSPQEAGSFFGTVWFYIQYVPLQGGEKIEQPISAQIIKIKAVSLLGLTSGTARILGTTGVMLAALLFWPFLKNRMRNQLDQPGA